MSSKKVLAEIYNAVLESTHEANRDVLHKDMLRFKKTETQEFAYEVCLEEFTTPAKVSGIWLRSARNWAAYGAYLKAHNKPLYKELATKIKAALK